MGTPDETTVWIGLDIGKTEHFADVLDEAGSPLFAVAVANDEAASRGAHPSSRGVLRRPGSGRRPARLTGLGSCSVSPQAAACRWHTCRGRSCAVPLTSTRVSPRPTAATRSCWPTPAATRRHQVRWLGCRQRRTPGAAARSQRLRHRPRRRRDAALQPPAGCAHQCFPGPGARTGPQAPQCEGQRDLLARYPTPQALATAGRGRIARTLRKRSPRLAAALTEAVTGALDAQTVVLPGSVAMGRW